MKSPDGVPPVEVLRSIVPVKHPTGSIVYADVSMSIPEVISQPGAANLSGLIIDELVSK